MILDILKFGLISNEKQVTIWSLRIINEIFNNFEQSKIFFNFFDNEMGAVSFIFRGIEKHKELK